MRHNVKMLCKILSRVFGVPVRLHQLTVVCRLCSSTSENKERKKWSEIRTKQKTQYPDGWKPKKKLTRYQMDYLRTLKQDYPEEWSVNKLASQFGVSPPAVVRILKSRWEPSPEVGEKQDSRALELKEQRKQEAIERRGEKHDSRALELKEQRKQDAIERRGEKQDSRALELKEQGKQEAFERRGEKQDSRALELKEQRKQEAFERRGQEQIRTVTEAKTFSTETQH